MSRFEKVKNRLKKCFGELDSCKLNREDRNSYQTNILLSLGSLIIIEDDPNIELSLNDVEKGLKVMEAIIEASTETKN